jgi:hypothetical protein
VAGGRCAPGQDRLQLRKGGRSPASAGLMFHDLGEAGNPPSVCAPSRMSMKRPHRLSVCGQWRAAQGAPNGTGGVSSTV